MRAFTLSLPYSHPCFLFLRPSTASANPSFSPSNLTSYPSISIKYLLSPSRLAPNAANSDLGGRSEDEDDDDYEDFVLVTGEQTDCVEEDGVFIKAIKLGSNTRRIQAKIAMEATLEVVWSILTDYDGLADFVPGLAESKLIEKKGNHARVFQIGQQELAFGLTFRAKSILDCFEGDLVISATSRKRDVEFKMSEGDFKVFQGIWSVEQFDNSISGDGKEYNTTLWYSLDVKPKVWLPVHLIEGLICKEIKANLLCMREAAKKMMQKTLHA